MNNENLISLLLINFIIHFEYFEKNSLLHSIMNNNKEYRYNISTILEFSILNKLYGIRLEKKINEWIEMEGKRDKGQASFRRNHSTTYHLLTLRIITKEHRNNNCDPFCFFVDFRKSFDTLPRNNLWNRLEELKVPFELIVFATKLYEKVISKFKNNKG